MAEKLLGKPVQEAIFMRLKARISQVTKTLGRPPKLDVILVGDDPASRTYVSAKERAADRIGILSQTHHLSVKSSAADLKKLVSTLNESEDTDGILLQRPVPITELSNEDLSLIITPKKDVDCFHPESLGRIVQGLDSLAPCTPEGIIKLLEHYRIEILGRTACIVGRSLIVGKPMAALLLNKSATVIHCHSKTKKLENFTKIADLLIVAAGKKHLITSKHIKAGAVVVDVGMHRNSDGTLTGDVDPSCLESLAHAYTPVPGGVGPMTIAQLMENTVRAAEMRSGGGL